MWGAWKATWRNDSAVRKTDIESSDENAELLDGVAVDKGLIGSSDIDHVEGRAWVEQESIASLEDSSK